MENHRGVKLRKAKGRYSENRTANVQMSRTYNLAISVSLQLLYMSIPIAEAASPILFNCSTWSFIMASRARQTPWSWRRRGFSIHWRHYSWEEMKDNRWEGLQRHLPLTIFYAILLFLAKALVPLEENLLACCIAGKSNIWTPRHSLKGLWPPPYRISHLRQ